MKTSVSSLTLFNIFLPATDHTTFYRYQLTEGERAHLSNLSPSGSLSNSHDCQGNRQTA